MIAASDIKEHVGPYVIQFERFDREVGGHQPAWLRDLRGRAMGAFARLGFPSTREEAWRFTSVAPRGRARGGGGRGAREARRGVLERGSAGSRLEDRVPEEVRRLLDAMRFL
jgi:hypothetical protein